VLAAAGCVGQGQGNSVSRTSTSSTTATSSTSSTTSAAASSSTSSTTATSSTSSTTSAAAAPQPTNVPTVSSILFKKPTEVTLPTADPQVCVREGEDDSVFEPHAWRVGSSAIVCAHGAPAWEDRIIGFDVYFPRRVTAEQADAAVRPLLPSDVKSVGTFKGTNNDVSNLPSGTCVAAVFTSISLGAATRALHPEWANPDSAEVILYSGNATAGDGSTSQYDATRVHLASVGIGDPRQNNSNGSVIC